MVASQIDIALLPQRALFDTGVVIRALGDRPSDTMSPCCARLWAAMLQNNREILVAAPTVAEMIRSRGKPRIPHRRGVEVVSFDDQAAELLGVELPESVLKQKQKTLDLREHYIKYDAIIVACAKRHKATHVVSLDRGVIALATTIKLTAKAPADFESKQVDLAYEP